MSSTTRFRRLAGAACLVLGPVLLTIAFAIMPWQTSDGTALDTLNLIGADVTTVQIADLLAFAGILVLIPALLTLMRALGGRAAVLGLVGGALSIAGAVGAMLVVVSDQMMIALADQTDLRPAAAAALDSSPAWALNVVLVVFLGGTFIGAIILGAGLLRSRIVPVWAGVALILAPVVSIAAHIVDRKAIDVVGSLLQLAAFTVVALRVAATDDAAWEKGELAGATRPAGAIVSVA